MESTDAPSTARLVAVGVIFGTLLLDVCGFSQELVHKLAQLVVATRFPAFSDESNAGRSNTSAWFNLVLVDVPQLRTVVESELARVATNHFLVQLDVLLQLPSLAQPVLLERWSVHCERSETRVVDRHAMYKRMIILVRSLYSFLRLLPGNSDPGFELVWKFTAVAPGGHPLTIFDAPPANFCFSSVTTTSGKLHVSVFYRKECNFGIAQRKPAATLLGAPGRIIENYMDRKRPEDHLDRKSASRVALNTASASELTCIPGVSQALAERIVASRPYPSWDSLEAALDDVQVKVLVVLKRWGALGSPAGDDISPSQSDDALLGPDSETRAAAGLSPIGCGQESPPAWAATRKPLGSSAARMAPFRPLGGSQGSGSAPTEPVRAVADEPPFSFSESPTGSHSHLSATLDGDSEPAGGSASRTRPQRSLSDPPQPTVMMSVTPLHLSADSRALFGGRPGDAGLPQERGGVISRPLAIPHSKASLPQQQPRQSGRWLAESPPRSGNPFALSPGAYASPLSGSISTRPVLVGSPRDHAAALGTPRRRPSSRASGPAPQSSSSFVAAAAAADAVGAVHSPPFPFQWSPSPRLASCASLAVRLTVGQATPAVPPSVSPLLSPASDASRPASPASLSSEFAPLPRAPPGAPPTALPRADRPASRWPLGGLLTDDDERNDDDDGPADADSAVGNFLLGIRATPPLSLFLEPDTAAPAAAASTPLVASTGSVGSTGSGSIVDGKRVRQTRVADVFDQLDRLSAIGQQLSRFTS